MPSKRKAEHFDPNKSDSADTDFDPTETRSAPRKSRQSAGHKKGSSRPSKRARYRGSDVSDDDDLDDDDLSVSEPSEEEEDIEMNEKTGRRVRKAAKKSVNYEEDSGSEEDDLEASDSEEVKVTKNKSPKKRSAKPVFDDDDDEDDVDEEVLATPPRSRRTKIITLKVNTPALARSTRAGSALRSAAGTGPRRGSTAEPKSAGIPTRRSTRATSEAMGEEPIALSESGHHVVRQGHSPEPLSTGRRADRGGKGLKKPASTIKEELHESTSHGEQDDDVVMATQMPGTDDQEEVDQLAVQELDENEQEEPVDDGADGAQAAEGDDEGDDDDDEDEDLPVTRRRGSRPALVVSDLPADEEEEAAEAQSAGGSRRLRTRSSKNKKEKKPTDASSDFEPVEESADEISASDAGRDKNEDDYESGSQRRGRRGAQAKSKSTSRRRSPDSNPEELDEDELAEELYDLKAGSRRRRPRISEPGIVYEKSTTRKRKPVDYSIKPMDQIYAMDEDGEEAAPTPSRRAKGGRNGTSQPWERNLYSTLGPFGGGGGPAAAIGGPWGTGAAGGVDSDSSDDENMARPIGVGGNIGMTPTSAMPPGLLPGLGQTNMDPTGALAGTPSALGKVGSRKALADADPLGVDQNVDFSKIGGLDGHIDQLKEMVQMPLLYPELFMKFHVTPPRGVLFHGPPGTGKTLLARALAATVGSGGRKITFYMRKGADALSKWVGEAEETTSTPFRGSPKNSTEYHLL